MNEELAKLLGELDQSCVKNSEHSILSMINKVIEEDQSTEAVAERIAFGFCEDYLDKENGWGTYYGSGLVTMARHMKVLAYLLSAKMLLTIGRIDQKVQIIQ